MQKQSLKAGIRLVKFKIRQCDELRFVNSQSFSLFTLRGPPRRIQCWDWWRRYREPFPQCPEASLMAAGASVPN